MAKAKPKTKRPPTTRAKAKPKATPAPPYWRDAVGQSGVYPMSGPLPKGNAPLRGQMEFGQGERGAAGYYDAGGSELVYSGGQLLGGLSAGPGGAPGPEPKSARAPARPITLAPRAPKSKHKPKRKPPQRKAA
ncbi:MAG TPA: hypothetical protein VMV31_08450 [Terriglobales bacterium]|nr:hypothetical protein [Terriglobales bacterium]